MLILIYKEYLIRATLQTKKLFHSSRQTQPKNTPAASSYPPLHFMPLFGRPSPLRSLAWSDLVIFEKGPGMARGADFWGSCPWSLAGNFWESRLKEAPTCFLYNIYLTPTWATRSQLQLTPPRPPSLRNSALSPNRTTPLPVAFPGTPSGGTSAEIFPRSRRIFLYLD